MAYDLQEPEPRVRQNRRQARPNSYCLDAGNVVRKDISAMNAANGDRCVVPLVHLLRAIKVHKIRLTPSEANKTRARVNNCELDEESGFDEAIGPMMFVLVSEGTKWTRSMLSACWP